MINKHIMPNCATYNSLVHGYLSLGQWKEAVRILKEMSRDGQRPNVVTYGMLIDYLSKSERCAEARENFNSMIQRVKTPMPPPMEVCFMGMLPKEILLK